MNIIPIFAGKRKCGAKMIAKSVSPRKQIYTVITAHNQRASASNGHETGGKRTHDGQDTDKIRAIDGRRTSAGLRGALVVRARLCSSVVRSAFGRVLCGVRIVLVRVAFVRGGSQGEAKDADCG